MNTLVLEQRDGAVVTLTLNDPAKRNAFSHAMREQLIGILTRLNGDDACRAIILTGAAGVFCSGGDISEMAPRTLAVSRERLVLTTNLARLMLTGPKPIVAAVEGYAMGAGLGLAAACDYAIVAADARLACAFLRMGLLPDFAAWWIIPRRVGLAKAQEMFGLARDYTAQEAVHMGLASELAPPGSTMDRAREIAARYAARPPGAVAALRGAMAEGFSSLEAAIQYELVAQPLMQRTADHKEAVAAFREKRGADFSGD